MKNSTSTKQEKRRVRELSDFWFYTILACLIFCFLSAQNLKAQLTGYGYKDAIKVQENSGSQKVNYQVLLNINTAALVSAGKMQANGNDIRFAKDCKGATLLNYYIESGMNTANTQIWVEVDTLKASGSYIMYMWYGNKTAVAASSFANTFPSTTVFIDSTGTQTIKGVNNYSWFEIRPTDTVKLVPDSLLVIKARRIKISGVLDGNGAGFLGALSQSNGNGPGAGGTPTDGNVFGDGGGGASYGGSGGTGGDATGTPSGQLGQAGPTYGTMNTDSIDMGSGGGGGSTTGGAGGGGITLWADVIDITGTITAEGSGGTLTTLNGGGGGGSGGGIRIKGNRVSFTGLMTADGGSGGGGAYSGGGGGGGRIKIFSDASIVNTGSELVNGGPIGTENTGIIVALPGSAGTTFAGTFKSKVPTYTILPHVGLSASSNPACQGTPVTFTATNTGGFNAFNFYVDATSKQNGIATTYSNSTLKNGDTVKVLAADVKGCMDTSNKVIMTINPSPTVTASATSTLICQGGSTTLNSSGATSYAWSDGSTGSSVLVSPKSTTTYTVTGTNSSGCSNTDTITISVQVCTDVQQITSADFDFKSYPTLTRGIFTIEANFGSAKQVVIEMNNMLGQKMQTIEDGQLKGDYVKEVNISGLPGGIYFLILKADGKTEVKKIVKQ